MKIKLATFKSSLTHSETFSAENEEFIKGIEEELNDKLILSDIADYDCDLKLIFIQTGGSEGLFLKNYDSLKEPYYLLTSGGNNSLAASIEILSYLKLNNKQGEILHGTSKYLANRIKELAIINKAKDTLSKAKLGLVGKPSDWLIASTPNELLLKEKLGISLVDISLEEVENRQNKSFDSIVNNYDTNFNKKEINGSIDVYNALKEIVEINQLDGLSIRCFDLLTSIKRTGCLALSKLNDEGIIGTCEGDIMTMVSMLIIKALTNQESFQANPSRIDVVNNEIVFAHCTIPLKMTTSYKFDTHFESGIGVAIKGELKEEDVTIFRLSADLKNYTLLSGKIVANLNESNLCRTQIKVKLDSEASILLKNPSGNHHVICYGKHSTLIESLLKQVL